METLEELKAIIDGKPERNTATEFAVIFGKVEYYRPTKLSGWYYFDVCKWIPIDRPDFATRSLSDIERIIELMGILEDTAALGFLTPSFDSGVSHKKLCKKYEALK